MTDLRFCWYSSLGMVSGNVIALKVTWLSKRILILAFSLYSLQKSSRTCQWLIYGLLPHSLESLLILIYLFTKTTNGDNKVRYSPRLRRKYWVYKLISTHFRTQYMPFRCSVASNMSNFVPIERNLQELLLFCFNRKKSSWKSSIVIETRVLVWALWKRRFWRWKQWTPGTFENIPETSNWKDSWMKIRTEPKNESLGVTQTANSSWETRKRRVLSAPPSERNHYGGALLTTTDEFDPSVEDNMLSKKLWTRQLSHCSLGLSRFPAKWHDNEDESAKKPAKKTGRGCEC